MKPLAHIIECQDAKASSTLRSSRAVPHPSTNRALRRLTSEVRRDPVHSTRYGRQRTSYLQQITEAGVVVAVVAAALVGWLLLLFCLLSQLLVVCLYAVFAIWEGSFFLSPSGWVEYQGFQQALRPTWVICPNQADCL